MNQDFNSQISTRNGQYNRNKGNQGQNFKYQKGFENDITFRNKNDNFKMQTERAGRNDHEAILSYD